jgi:hypothetical protein
VVAATTAIVVGIGADSVAVSGARKAWVGVIETTNAFLKNGGRVQRSDEATGKKEHERTDNMNLTRTATNNRYNKFSKIERSTMYGFSI